MSSRALAALGCACAIGSAEAGCAKKRAEVAALPPVTIAKSYPGKAAADRMREAIGKLRPRPDRPAPTTRKAPPGRADEQPVGTIGSETADGTPRSGSGIGRETLTVPPPAPAARSGSAAATANPQDERDEGMDPLLPLIVGGWIALLVLLPLAIRYGTRG